MKNRNLLLNFGSSKGVLSSSIIDTRRGGLSPDDFAQFLIENQKTPVPKDQIEQIQKAVFMERGCQGEMNFDQFCDFLLSNRNSFCNWDVYTPSQRMDYPLNEYFIASSHNTYLEGDQLKSKASAEVYSTVLETGCRCIEIDVWDGPDGEPEVFHGHTLTTKEKLVPIIQAIAISAFKVSHYPVIISIENHCSIPQQERLAQIIQSHLGKFIPDVTLSEVSNLKRIRSSLLLQQINFISTLGFHHLPSF